MKKTVKYAYIFIFTVFINFNLMKERAAITSAQSRFLRKTILILVIFWSIASDTSAFRFREEPKSPVCRAIKKNSLPFCTMIDYVAVVDSEDKDGLDSDTMAKMYYDNVNTVLLRFGCSFKYSLHSCESCREAYKYWICSIKFQKCGYAGNSTKLDKPDDEYHHSICMERNLSGKERCQEGINARHRTCLSICEDVVRKCPYVLNFQCPSVRLYSSNSLVCDDTILYLN